MVYQWFGQSVNILKSVDQSQFKVNISKSIFQSQYFKVNISKSIVQSQYFKINISKGLLVH